MRRAVLVVCILAFGSPAAWAVTDTNGELFYTTFAGGANIHKTNYSWVGGVFSISGNGALGPGVPGADGILFLPNGNLAVGAQGLGVHEVTTAGALVTTLPVPTAAFHLSLSPAGTMLYSSGIPGVPSAITLNGSGGLTGAASAVLPIVVGAGGSSVLDTIAFVTSGPNAGQAFYTNSGSGGGGAVGQISFAPNADTPGAIATTTAQVGLPASHGAVYDPFSQTIITMGADEVSQIDAGTGAVLSTLSFAGLGLTFDQGTVDGLGHIFAASNSGTLVFIDYSTTAPLGSALHGLTGAAFDGEFLAVALDDIAPKVGPGAQPGVPEPGTLLIWSLLAAVGIAAGWRRRARRAS